MLKEKKGKLAEIFETRINGRPLEGASKHLAINNDRARPRRSEHTPEITVEP